MEAYHPARAFPGGWRPRAIQSTPQASPGGNRSQLFTVGLCGMDSSFRGSWDLGYLTDLRASIVGQMYLTCLEGVVGWDRHCGFLPSGDPLSFLVILLCPSGVEAERSRYFPRLSCG